MRSSNEAKTNYSWDLSGLFKDESEWMTSLKKYQQVCQQIKNLKGELNQREQFLKYLELDSEANHLFTRLNLYVHLLDLNQTSVEFQKLESVFKKTFFAIDTELSFLKPEILNLDMTQVFEWIKTSKYKQYQNYFSNLFKQAPHILNKESEELLSSVARSRESAAEIYQALAYADKRQSEIDYHGKKVVDTTFYKMICEDSDPNSEQELRQEVVQLYFKNFIQNKFSFAKIYEGILTQHFETAKLRKYNSSLEMSLASDEMSPKIYEKLLQVGKENIQQLKDYYLLIKNKYKMKKFYSTDRELVLVKEISKNYSIANGKKIVIDALKNLGSEYEEFLHRSLADGQVDYLESANKVSGAYSTSASEFDPLILMNWDNKLNSVTTLAHEVGHSVHTLFSEKFNKYPASDYTIILAEVASTFNEHILFDYLFDLTNSNEEKIYLLQQRIFDLVSTFYRQIQFAEFEYEAHKLVQNQQPLTADELMNLFKGVENKYGYDIFDDHDREVYQWPFISHMFEAPFYVYKYAVDLVASFKLYSDYKNGDLKIIEFLKKGGSKPPLEILKECDVDFENDATYKPLILEITNLTQQLKKLLEKK